MAKSDQRCPAIIIDTREQLPYSFPESKRARLATGDYSLEGLENKVAVERKSKGDLFGSLGGGRDRFQREFERMARMDYAAVVVEANLTDLLIAPERSRMSPRAVINSLVAWGIRYRVQIYLADTRVLANTLTFRILEKYWREHAKQKDLP